MGNLYFGRRGGRVPADLAATGGRDRPALLRESPAWAQPEDLRRACPHGNPGPVLLLTASGISFGAGALSARADYRVVSARQQRTADRRAWQRDRMGLHRCAAGHASGA